MLKKITLLLAVLLAATFMSCGGGFYSLKSSRYVTKMGKKFRLPYVKTVKYYGYINPDVKPQGKYRGKDAYYLYMWVPLAIDEVGVAMYSPAKSNPTKKDFVHPQFKENFEKAPDAYFDTYLALERMVVLQATKSKDAKDASTHKLSTNDDTSEIPANPGGRRYNSLLRVKTQTSNIAKALVRSVYRITFTSFRGNVEGSYLVQVGTNIPGVKIAASLERLHKLVNESGKKKKKSE